MPTKNRPNFFSSVLAYGRELLGGRNHASLMPLILQMIVESPVLAYTWPPLH